MPGRSEATIRSELGALRRPQVVLTLLVATVGFGGMFAMYSYIAPTVTDEAGRPAGFVPVVLLAFGAGGVAGDGARRPARRPGAVPVAGGARRPPSGCCSR